MSTSPAYCGRCGRPLTDPGADPGHQGCVEALRLEPPRYCPSCRRRMVVQVTPDGWSATCSVHGTVHQSTWST